MADDAVLNVGFDTGKVDASLRALQQQITAQFKSIENVISSQLGKAEKSINDFARASNRLSAEQIKTAQASKTAGTAIKDNAAQTKKSGNAYVETAKAVTALAQAFDTVADRAFNALGVIAAAGGAYLGARSGAGDLERANEGLISSTVRLAGAYVSVRGAFRSFVDLIGTGAQFEAQRIQLQALFNSAAQGNAAFDWIRSVPIQAQGFTDGLIQLRNFGVDNLQKSLLALNDLVIKTGDEQGKLARIARQLGQGFAQNALRAEELNSLVDNGVPIFELLSKAMGVSASEIRKLASQSKIGREEIRLLFDEIGKSAAGAAENQLNTFGGLITTLQRQFREFTNLIAESGIFEFVKEQIRAFLTEIDRLRNTGQLRAIAQNISDALVGVGEGVVALITELLQSLQKLSADGSLAEFGRTFGDVLQTAAPLIGVITDRIGLLIKSFIAFKAVSAIFSVVFNAAQIIAVVAALIKYRVAILAAASTTFSFVSSATAAGVAAGGFSGALNLLALAAKGTAIALGATLAITGAFAAGYYIANRSVQRQIELQKQLQREVEADTKVTTEFLAIRQELNKLQDQGTDAQVAQLFKLRNLGAITDQEALTRARELLQAAVDRNNKIVELTELQAGAEKRLQDLRVKREEQANERIRLFRRSVLQEQIQANQQRVNDAKKVLQQIENEEEKAAKRIIDIQKEITDGRRELNAEIFDVQQSGRDESTQAFFAQLEALKQIKEAQAQNAKAAAATTDEERKAALEAAKAAEDRVKDLAKDVGSNNQRITLLKQLQGVREQTLSAEQNAIEAEQKQREANKKALQETIQLQQQNLASLEGQLDRLQRNTKDIKLNLETKKAQDELAKIQKQLEQIKRDAAIDVQIRRAGGGSVPGLAAGGQVSGPGGIDRVPAWLTAGEFVIKKSAVERYGLAFLSAINSMRLPSVKIPQYNIPIARPASGNRFAAGGAVSGGDTVTLNLKINNRSAGPVTGSREAIDMIVDALTTAARATA